MNIQGNVSRAYFPTSWLSDQSGLWVEWAGAFGELFNIGTVSIILIWQVAAAEFKY